ncbi:hypothetical protein OXX79_000330 [Metschnikowia pulcherrima]
MCASCIFYCQHKCRHACWITLARPRKSNKPNEFHRISPHIFAPRRNLPQNTIWCLDCNNHQIGYSHNPFLRQHKMTDFPELEVLVDAFPQYPRSELAERLLCASSPEVLFNELAIEAVSGIEVNENVKESKKFDAGVDRLKELFSTANRDVLAAALNENNGCVDKTIENMLENDPIQKLSKLSGLEEAELSPYMARNQNDVLRALADLIAHYKKRKKVRASRVQARNVATAAYEDAYKVHENSTEVLQLKECIWAEQALQEVNYDFLLKSLVFFQGNVPRVLDVARLFIEAGRQNLTYDHRLGFQFKEVPGFSQPSASVLRSKHASLISPRPLGPKLGEASGPSEVSSRSITPTYNVAIREKSPLLSIGCSKPISLAQPNTRPILQAAMHTQASRLDLHGYTVAQATAATKEAVSAWWAEEKESRTIEGHMERYGSRAEFVDPLQIITGRGIHSAGGSPRIRQSVIRLLNSEGYLFNEEVGRVDVFGRRPKKNK